MNHICPNTTALVPSSSLSPCGRETRSFHAFKEECTLDEDTLNRFRDRFQFPDETRVRLPLSGEKSCSFGPSEVCFYEAAFLCSLKFLVHPFIMELLHYLNIIPGKLMPNSWRIVISCMEIRMIVTDGDMIRLDEFVHLY